MIPAPTYDDLNTILNSDDVWTDGGPLETLKLTNKMLGVVFFSPNLELGPVGDFIKNIDILNLHSGKYVHFILPGISKYGQNKNDNGGKLCTLDGVDLYFNTKAFDSFREKFEHEIETWSFDYGIDLILMNVQGETPNRRIDFGSAIHFKVDELIKIGICDQASQVFGRIIKFTRENDIYDVNEIRQLFETAFGINWFKGLLLGMFPKTVRNLARGGAVLRGGRALPE